MSLPASALFYPEDRVTMKGRKEPKGSVLKTDDEAQLVTVKWDGHPVPGVYPKGILRRLSPNEDLPSDG